MESYIPIIAGITAGIYAGLEQTRKMNEEEEEMTPYHHEDLLEEWEFKILRSITGAFSSQIKLRKILHEEAQAGWVLVEKFDNNRIRLKRSIRDKDKGLYSGIDPYRSHIGMTESQYARIIIGGVLGIFGLIVFITIIFMIVSNS